MAFLRFDSVGGHPVGLEVFTKVSSRGRACNIISAAAANPTGLSSDFAARRGESPACGALRESGLGSFGGRRRLFSGPRSGGRKGPGG